MQEWSQPAQPRNEKNEVHQNHRNQITQQRNKMEQVLYVKYCKITSTENYFPMVFECFRKKPKIGQWKNVVWSREILTFWICRSEKHSPRVMWPFSPGSKMSKSACTSDKAIECRLPEAILSQIFSFCRRIFCSTVSTGTFSSSAMESAIRERAISRPLFGVKHSSPDWKDAGGWPLDLMPNDAKYAATWFAWNPWKASYFWRGWYPRAPGIAQKSKVPTRLFHWVSMFGLEWTELEVVDAVVKPSNGSWKVWSGFVRNLCQKSLDVLDTDNFLFFNGHLGGYTPCSD